MKTLRMAILGAAALLMAWVSASAYADFAAYSEVVNLAAETTDVARRALATTGAMPPTTHDGR